MPDKMMNTKEVAEYLDIHEKQVYSLIKAKKIPCTRVTGKWLFPKDLIDEWIKNNSHFKDEKLKKGGTDHTSRALLAAGSNDPVLDVLFTAMKQKYPTLHVYTSSTGSTDGLNQLKNGLVDIAWCHLLDPNTGGYNIPYVASQFNESKIAIVHLFYRELGLVVPRGISSGIKSIEDLSKNGVSFVNRQKGSGTRLLLDWKLLEFGIDPVTIKGYENEVYTHLEVGLSIMSGVANAGIATIAIANLMGLDFYPIKKESFDMVLMQPTFFDKWVMGFIETLNSMEFKKKVGPLGNYDFSEAGKIIYSSAENQS